MWLNMPHWSDCINKTSSVNPVSFSRTFVTLFSAFGAFALFKEYANSLHFCFLFRGVSLWNGLPLRRCFTENILPRVMCEYKEDMDTELRLNEFELCGLFSGLGKVIGSLLYSGPCIFLRWGHLRKECLCSIPYFLFPSTHPVCFTGGATEFSSMRFSQSVCFSGYSGVFAFGHLFHN